ncbi:unnamed protein product [Dimorphilus gyrociliatus]|uniref:Uncharacterized protein n=1 Tax=Dimorphilus gyrociliatus TaxID=2664684 RepID=A0A7I8W1K3_9ANNE|nr:unnamed protein product [Dimorphilus gyrociliatus]
MSGELNLTTIGCLPDNLQRSIVGFSIKPGRKFVTFCYSKMLENLRRSIEEDEALCTTTVEYGDYRAIITWSWPCNLVLFTLYEKDGYLIHFHKLIELIDTEDTLKVILDINAKIQISSDDSLTRRFRFYTFHQYFYITSERIYSSLNSESDKVVFGRILGSLRNSMYSNSDLFWLQFWISRIADSAKDDIGKFWLFWTDWRTISGFVGAIDAKSKAKVGELVRSIRPCLENASFEKRLVKVEERRRPKKRRSSCLLSD